MGSLFLPKTGMLLPCLSSQTASAQARRTHKQSPPGHLQMDASVRLGLDRQDSKDDDKSN